MTKKLTFAKALVFAADAHGEQKDKGGHPYIQHALEVARLLKKRGYDEETQMCGLLHDVFEDTDALFSDLLDLGCSPRLFKALKAMTHTVDEKYIQQEIDAADKHFPMDVIIATAKKKEYFRYIEKVSKDPLANPTKEADLDHNSDPNRLKDLTVKSGLNIIKYAEAKIMILRARKELWGK